MNQTRAYWISQIVGWTFYEMFELITYFTLFTFNFEEFNASFGNAVVNVFSGILLTHLFRLIFKKFHWIKVPITQLILRCLGVTASITFLLAAINIPMDGDIINTEKVNWFLRDLTYLLNLGKPVLIWVLIYVFYSFITDRQHDALERVQLESSVRETEAKVLRAQMNPHFIFNALNSIRALISEDPKKAILGITQLSNILRSSLVADRRNTVTLKEELKTIDDYLALEKVRYEERLQIKKVIDPASLNAHLPPMLLQTLVENAIKHGVQKANRWGFVEIATQLKGEHLYIRIRNTGKFEMNKETKLNSGFGLENTRKRLKLLFGDDASMRVFQENHLTVCAEIILPREYQI